MRTVLQALLMSLICESDHCFAITVLRMHSTPVFCPCEERIKSAFFAIKDIASVRGFHVVSRPEAKDVHPVSIHLIRVGSTTYFQ